MLERTPVCFATDPCNWIYIYPGDHTEYVGYGYKTQNYKRAVLKKTPCQTDANNTTLQITAGTTVNKWIMT